MIQSRLTCIRKIGQPTHSQARGCATTFNPLHLAITFGVPCLWSAGFQSSRFSVPNNEEGKERGLVVFPSRICLPIDRSKE